MNFYNLYAVRSVFSYRNLKIEMMLHVCCFIFLLAHVDLIVSLEHASSTHFECISVFSLKLVRRHFSRKIRSSLLLSIGVLNDCLYGSQPSLHKEISEIINKTLIRMNFQWTSFWKRLRDFTLFHVIIEVGPPLPGKSNKPFLVEKFHSDHWNVALNANNFGFMRIIIIFCAALDDKRKVKIICSIKLDYTGSGMKNVWYFRANFDSFDMFRL